MKVRCRRFVIPAQAGIQNMRDNRVPAPRLREDRPCAGMTLLRFRTLFRTHSSAGLEMHSVRDSQPVVGQFDICRKPGVGGFVLQRVRNVGQVNLLRLETFDGLQCLID